MEDNESAVVFNQLINGSYNGHLAGSGIGSKIGPAQLTFPANIQNRLLSLNILEGELKLDGTLTAAETHVAPSATLSGGGTLIGDLEVFGTLTPRDGPLTFTVVGSVEFEPGSTYRVEVLGGDASLLNVTTFDDDDDGPGTVIIEENAAVEVVLLDGSYNPQQTYTIISADTSLSGKFSSSQINDPLLAAVISYDKQHAFLRVQNAVSLLGSTFNQKQVAQQLGTISTSNPLINAFLLSLVRLPSEQSQRALSQMSAEQYTQIFTTAQGVNQRFIHRMFDPLWDIISPSCIKNSCCEDCYGNISAYSNDSCCQQFKSWMDVSYDQGYYKGNRNANGYKMHGYEFTLGIQTSLDSCWTLGTAGSYEMDHLDFNLGGSGKNHTWLGGLYALYTPQNYYVLADLVLGYSSQSVRRSINVPPFNAKLKGKPHLFQGAAYVEAGLNYGISCFGIQPFIGVQTDYFNLQGIRENKDNFLAVHVSKKSFTDAFSRLGVHLTTNRCQYALAVAIST